MLTVHHLDNSRSQRVLWLLEELELDYELKTYKRDAATMLAPASLKEVHPLGKSPVVTDGDLVLAESGAILEYLVDRYGAGRFRPAAASPDYLPYRYWLHYAEGSAMPPLLIKLLFDRIEAEPVPFLIKPVVSQIAQKVRKAFIDPQLALHFDHIEAELGRTPWFGGTEFSAADVQMSFPLEVGATRGGLSTTRPNIMAFLEKIRARPAYQRAIERGGPFAVLS